MKKKVAEEERGEEEKRRKCTARFVLDINKGAILSSDSGSLLHQILPAVCILCSSEPGNQELVFDSLH